MRFHIDEVRVEDTNGEVRGGVGREVLGDDGNGDVVYAFQNPESGGQPYDARTDDTDLDFPSEIVNCIITANLVASIRLCFFMKGNACS